MKKIIINILATTCLVMLIIIIIGMFTYDRVFDLHSEDFAIPAAVFFQVLLTNIIIYSGFIFTRKFESRYAILEYLLDISLVIGVVLVFGTIFEWYKDFPWLLAFMAVIIYLFGLLTGLVRARKDIKDINELLQKRKEKNTDNP